MITDIDGIEVGNWSDIEAKTGCTVILFPEGTTASGEIRGGAPATRDFSLLHPSRLVDHVDAVVLSGGSAYGLAACEGVMDFLEGESLSEIIKADKHVPVKRVIPIFMQACEALEHAHDLAGLRAVVAEGVLLSLQKRLLHVQLASSPSFPEYSFVAFFLFFRQINFVIRYRVNETLNWIS